MKCPACGFTLRPQRAGSCMYAACELCGGLSIDTLKSLQLWAAMDEQREPLPAVLGAEVPRRAEHCWKCQGAMESFPYMEDPTVSLQRCGACRLLWVPGDQQEGARALWAKRAGREGTRLERKADMTAAYRPSVSRVAGARGRVRVHVGSDVGAQVDYLLNERERDRES